MLIRGKGDRYIFDFTLNRKLYLSSFPLLESAASTVGSAPIRPVDVPRAPAVVVAERGQGLRCRKDDQCEREDEAFKEGLHRERFNLSGDDGTRYSSLIDRPKAEISSLGEKMKERQKAMDAFLSS